MTEEELEKKEEEELKLAIQRSIEQDNLEERKRKKEKLWEDNEFNEVLKRSMLDVVLRVYIIAT